MKCNRRTSECCRTPAEVEGRSGSCGAISPLPIVFGRIIFTGDTTAGPPARLVLGRARDGDGAELELAPPMALDPTTGRSGDTGATVLDRRLW